tara:strand:+ start:960 stop:1184 length:225 start_codon:yes stop_codon:yes gene_type:complete
MKTPHECKTFHQPTPYEFVIRVTLEKDPDLNILIKKKDLRLAGYIVRGFLFRKGYSNSTPFTTSITGEQIDLSI